MSKLPMPFSNPRTYPGHSGVDFPQSRGTAIRASGPGVVLRLSHTLAGGYWTVIRYDNGVTFGYAHQDRPVTVVKAGQRVSEGQVIGYVGSLGLRSTGPHLHLTDIDNQTYAATMARLDTSSVVGQGAPAGTGGTPVENGDEFMAKIDDLWQRWQPGEAGVKSAGDLYLLFAEMVKNVRTVATDAAKATWATPVSRDGGKVSALQELADSKTLGMQNSKKLDELLKRPAASVSLTDAQVDALAAKVGEKVALAIAPAVLDLMAKRLQS